MLCQLCLSKPAMMDVPERLPAGTHAVAHYCPECYEAKYLKPSPGPASFPRPRITLKRIMILVAGWSVPNACTAWIMRSGFITGTPQQLREWNIAAFLAVNLVLAFGVLCGAGLRNWLQKVMWYNQTGGVLPMPVLKPAPLKQQLKACLLLIPFSAWIVVAIFIEQWLTPRIWPGRRESPGLEMLLMWAPFLPFVVWGLYRGVWKNSAARERIRLYWSLMSPIERVLRVLAIIWMLGSLVLMFFSGPSLVRWGLKLWFPIPAAFVIVVAGQLVLMAGIAFSARRR